MAVNEDRIPSARQVAANRANAKNSTGPRTPEGKETSSRNATKTGIFADPDRPLQAGTFPEDPEEYRAHKLAFVSALNPANAVEEHLARKAWTTAIRATRLDRAEAHLLEGASQLAKDDSVWINVATTSLMADRRAYAMILDWSASRTDSSDAARNADFDFEAMALRLCCLQGGFIPGILDEDAAPTTADGWRDAFLTIADQVFDSPNDLVEWVTSKLSKAERELAAVHGRAAQIGAEQMLPVLERLAKVDARLSALLERQLNYLASRRMRAADEGEE